MTPRLFHVSDDPAIARFDPRPSPSTDAGVIGTAVWALAEPFLPNYLLPRDCPRICFRAGPQTTPEDRARFLGAASLVVAFEADWLDRVRSARLALYEMPPDTFACGRLRRIHAVARMKSSAYVACSSMPVAIANTFGSMMMSSGGNPARVTSRS